MDLFGAAALADEDVRCIEDAGYMTTLAGDVQLLDESGIVERIVKMQHRQGPQKVEHSDNFF